jgi:hypothetical protein
MRRSAKVGASALASVKPRARKAAGPPPSGGLVEVAAAADALADALLQGRGEEVGVLLRGPRVDVGVQAGHPQAQVAGAEAGVDGDAGLEGVVGGQVDAGRLDDGQPAQEGHAEGAAALFAGRGERPVHAEALGEHGGLVHRAGAVGVEIHLLQRDDVAVEPRELVADHVDGRRLARPDVPRHDPQRRGRGRRARATRRRHEQRRRHPLVTGAAVNYEPTVSPALTAGMLSTCCATSPSSRSPWPSSASAF